MELFMATAAEMLVLAWKYQQEGNFSQAEQFYRQVLRLHPNLVEVHNNLANVLQSQGKVEEAVKHWHEALRIRPDSVEAHTNLGAALVQLGNMEDAVTHCREAVCLRPDLPETQTNLGNALCGQGAIPEGVACYHQALRINPNFALAYNNLGNVLVQQGKPDEGAGCYQQAIRCQPDYAETHGNLGNVHFLEGRFDAAQVCYDEALRLNAGDPKTHFNQALLWLLLGKWAQGWPEYEWRWQTKGFPRHSFSQPRWDGSLAPQAGSTLLLLAEQGLGDTLHFVRYAALAQERGWRVILQCQGPLVRLLAGVRRIDQVLAEGSPLPHFDAYLPLLSFPGVWRTLPGTVPALVPYLQADAGLAEHWKRAMCDVRCAMSKKRAMCDVRCAMSEEPHLTSHIAHRTSNILVGIAWQGAPMFRSDRQRSIPLACFAGLARVQGVQLISLQKGPGTEQLVWTVDSGQWTEQPSHRPPSTVHRPPRRCGVLDLGTHLDEATGPFMDTAAVMKNLDLVISSDTAVPHLAGALGIPVWVALPIVPDWRWLLQREDSPWYPTMRLFRQTRQGQWEDVFDRIAEELTSVVRNEITDN